MKIRNRELKKFYVTWNVNGKPREAVIWDYSKELAALQVEAKYMPKVVEYEKRNY